MVGVVLVAVAAVVAVGGGMSDGGLVEVGVVGVVVVPVL
jgi:hypothetical protein